MITYEDARNYVEQLHPAFAGYLHDGTVTQRDALATIFNLFTNGTLEPIWKDNSLLKSINGAKLVKQQTKYKFEQEIINKLFSTKRELSAKEIGQLIKNGEIQELIKKNLKAISTFPIINENLKFTLGKHVKVNFSVNGDFVDTLQEATEFKKLLYKILLPTFSGIGILLIISYFLFSKYLPQNNYYFSNSNISIQVQSNGKSGISLIITGVIFITVVLSVLLTFVFSKKSIYYNFKNAIVPIARKKYSELYEYIKSHPLEPHRFTNEFLAFSIAFGLDNSWYKDFGLEEEVKIDRTPLTEREV